MVSRRESPQSSFTDGRKGSLTVKETIEFAARLSLNSGRRGGRVGELIRAFGLEKQESTMIGTPVKKGISGGQKRRVSVASQLITRPKILFLDEPVCTLPIPLLLADKNVDKWLRLHRRLRGNVTHPQHRTIRENRCDSLDPPTIDRNIQSLLATSAVVSRANGVLWPYRVSGAVFQFHRSAGSDYD